MSGLSKIPSVFLGASNTRANAAFLTGRVGHSTGLRALPPVSRVAAPADMISSQAQQVILEDAQRQLPVTVAAYSPAAVAWMTARDENLGFANDRESIASPFLSTLAV